MTLCEYLAFGCAQHSKCQKTKLIFEMTRTERQWRRKKNSVYFSKCDSLTDKDERRRQTKKLITWNDPSNYARPNVFSVYVYTNQFRYCKTNAIISNTWETYDLFCLQAIQMCVRNAFVCDSADLWRDESKSRCFNGCNKNVLLNTKYVVLLCTQHSPAA